MLDTVVTWGTLGLSAGATAYALFHAWPAGTREQPGCLRSDEDNFAWALMSGVSCLPLFNSMVRVLLRWGVAPGSTTRPQAGCMHVCMRSSAVAVTVCACFCGPALPCTHAHTHAHTHTHTHTAL
jgi:hypothetical protein